MEEIKYYCDRCTKEILQGQRNKMSLDYSRLGISFTTEEKKRIEGDYCESCKKEIIENMTKKPKK